MNDFFHVLNPNRKNRKAVEKYFASHRSLSAVWVDRTQHPTHLETIVQWAVREGRTRLAIWGGDGTLSRAVQALREYGGLEKTELALFPSGTCNDLARRLGIPLWKNLVKKAASKNPGEHPLDIGLLTAGGRERTFINNSGFGRSGLALKEKRSNPIRDILAFEPKTLRMEWEEAGGTHFETRSAILGIVFNAPFFSGGLHFDKAIDPADGMLSLFCEPPRLAPALFAKFVKARLGKSLASAGTFRIDFTRLRIESNRDLFPQVDGEPVLRTAARVVEYSLLPQKLRFMEWN